MNYILQDKYSEDPIYFRKMTGMGPMGTGDIKQAEVFRNKEEALDSPATRHFLTDYEPIKLTDDNQPNKKEG